GRHERRGGRLEGGAHEGHPEFRHAKPAGDERLRLPRRAAASRHVHLDLVAAELGALGNAPRALGNSRGVPAEGQLVLLVAALVADPELARPVAAGGNGEAAKLLAPDPVLHGNRLPGKEAWAVENGLDVEEPTPGVAGQVEAPRLYPRLPARLE